MGWSKKPPFLNRLYVILLILLLCFGILSEDRLTLRCRFQSPPFTDQPWLQATDRAAVADSPWSLNETTVVVAEPQPCCPGVNRTEDRNRSRAEDARDRKQKDKERCGGAGRRKLRYSRSRSRCHDSPPFPEGQQAWAISCQREWRRVALLERRRAFTDSARGFTNRYGLWSFTRSKRSRQMLHKAWTIDWLPNPIGQACRNELNMSLRQHKGSNTSQAQDGPDPGSFSIILERLLLSQFQRKGEKASAAVMLVSRLLVLVACLLKLEDLSRRGAAKAAGKGKVRPTPTLPPALRILGWWGKRTARYGVTSFLFRDQPLSGSVTDDRHDHGLDSRKPKGFSVPRRQTAPPCVSASRVNGRAAPLDRRAGSNALQEYLLDLYKPNANDVLPHHESADYSFLTDLFLQRPTRPFTDIPATDIRVSPASFLPNGRVAREDLLDYLGYRLATLATLPSSCPLSRVRLAEAGFHFNPSHNPRAALCHRCGAAYSLAWSPSNGAASFLAFHHTASPSCSFLLSMLDAYSHPPAGVAPGQPQAGGPPDGVSGSEDVPPEPHPKPHQRLHHQEHHHQDHHWQQLKQSMAACDGVPAPCWKGETSGFGGNGANDLAADCDTPDSSLLPMTPVQPGPVTVAFTFGNSRDDPRVPPPITSPFVSSTPSPPSFSPSPSLSFPTAASCPGLGTLATSFSSGIDDHQNPRNATNNASNDGEGQSSLPTGLDLGYASHPLYISFQSRLDTFRNWPAHAAAILSPEELAVLGFFYAGYEDCVRCFYCGVGLKSWQEHDDPLHEHVRWRPGCGFIRATKGREFVEQLIEQQNSTPPEGDSNNTAVAAANALALGIRGRREAGQSTGPDDQDTSTLLQRLLTMGFTLADITRAQAHITATGETCDLDRMLNVLYSM